LTITSLVNGSVVAVHSFGHPSLQTSVTYNFYPWGYITDLIYQEKKMEIQDILHYCVSDVAYTVKNNPNKWMSATCSIHRHDRMCDKTEDGHLNIYLSTGINTLPNSMFTYSASFNIQVMINS